MDYIFQNQFFILLGLLAAGFGIGAWFLSDLKKKMRMVLGGPASKTDFQKNLAGRVLRTETKLEELEPRLKLVEDISRISVQKVGFLRFNPFSDTGGDQSFVLVLLDRGNNGFILSSLYTREGVRVYAKNIERGKPKHALSEEEKRVLEEAVNKGIATTT